MSPFIDSQLFDKKMQKKTLSISLEEGEDILKSIKEAMLQHKIKECSVAEINGKLSDGLINFFERSQYKTMKLKDCPLLRASGNFKLNSDELWGSMHISTAEKNVITGTLVKGKAAEGLEIKLSFIDM